MKNANYEKTFEALTRNEHSKEELHKMIVDMKKASAEFYNKAIHIGNHAFIEFTGLMNEYINCCMDALDKGEDFTKFNIHSGKSMMESCRKKYLIEKLECILGEEIVAKPNKEED